MEFWCPVCQKKSSAPFLDVASNDGHTLHRVCETHFPKDHKRDVTVMVKSQPNADGVVRTITFEDLLTALEKPPTKAADQSKEPSKKSA